MKNEKLGSVVIVYIFLIKGDALEYRFESISRICLYELYERLAQIEPELVSTVRNEHGYPDLVVNSSRATGICVREILSQQTK